MANGNDPDHREIWDAVNKARMELSEMKGMISMHFQSGMHHHPPCKPAEDLRKLMFSAVGAAVISLLAAVGVLVMEIIRG